MKYGKSSRLRSSEADIEPDHGSLLDDVVEKFAVRIIDLQHPVAGEGRVAPAEGVSDPGKTDLRRNSVAFSDPRLNTNAYGRHSGKHLADRWKHISGPYQADHAAHGRSQEA
jgi:hypothetical protein